MGLNVDLVGTAAFVPLVVSRGSERELNHRKDENQHAWPRWNKEWKAVRFAQTSEDADGVSRIRMAADVTCVTAQTP